MQNGTSSRGPGGVQDRDVQNAGKDMKRFRAEVPGASPVPLPMNKAAVSPSGQG